MTEQLKRLFIEIYKDNPQQMEYYVDKQMAKCADKQKRYSFRKAIANLKQKAITAMEGAEVKNGIIIYCTFCSVQEYHFLVALLIVFLIVLYKQMAAYA